MNHYSISKPKQFERHYLHLNTINTNVVVESPLVPPIFKATCTTHGFLYFYVALALFHQANVILLPYLFVDFSTLC